MIRLIIVVGLSLYPCSIAMAQPKLVRSKSLDFAGGQLAIAGYPEEVASSNDLLIHFHGDAGVCARNFEQSGIKAVLATVNFPGLSSAYRRPFEEDLQLFDRLLAEVETALIANGWPKSEVHWDRICLSSFSAGYGAVREILKQPRNFDRVSGLLAADSIYASWQEGTDLRVVDATQMRDFLRFAGLASREEKTFLLTHSQVATAYASTHDTADYLLEHLALRRQPAQRKLPPEANLDEQLLLVSRASQGGFLVCGYAGDTGEAHMLHLRQIHRWWRELPLPKH